MKKVLLMLMLCPFMAMAQGTLVTWNSTSQPTGLTNLTAQAINGGGGVSINQLGWAGGFQVKDLHWNSASTSINLNKYVEFRANPNSGYQMKPSQFVFITRSGDTEARKMEVRVSNNGTTWSSLTNASAQTVFSVSSSAQTYTLNFPSNYTVLPTQTLIIRVYYYDFSNDYYSDSRILNTEGNASTQGPTLKGTVTPAGGVIANADSATTVANYGKVVDVLANDTATNTTFASVTIVTQPNNGTATVQADKTILYSPNNNFTGQNQLQYKVTGADGTTATAWVTMTVNPIVLPVSVNDNVTTNRDTAKIINVLANDTAGSGTITSMVITMPAQHGTTTVNADNTITYTPDSNYTGQDNFKYKVTDSYNKSSMATVNISVLVPLGVAMSGTYYVGTGGDFTTLTSAVAHLNQYGVAGPVKFLLTNSVYSNDLGETFPLTITQFAGTSATNTVTFKPAPTKNVTVEATNSNGWTGVNSIFLLKGADNIIFDGSNTTNGTTRNFKLNNKDILEYVGRTLIWIASDGSNGATNTVIKNMNLRQDRKNQGGQYCMGVYSGNYAVNTDVGYSIVAQQATANNDKIRITNNDFMNVKQGVFVNGGTTQTTNVTIYQNDLGAEDNSETIIEPVCLTNVNTFEYSENLVYNLFRGTNDGDFASAGIIVNGNTQNGSILRNNMKNLEKTGTNDKTFAGIILASTNTNSNILVANNFILNVVGQGNGGGYLNGYGIIVDNGGGYKIYHNTVVLNKNQPNGGFSAALYVNTGASNLDVRNNIFANNQTNTGTRRSAIVVKNSVDLINTIFTNLDYNNYYSVDRIGFIGNLYKNDLGKIDWPGNGIQGDYNDNADYFYTIGAWKNITGKDQHSVNHNTVFASATDLHLNTGNSAIDNEGTPIAAVTKDIDGQARSTQHPTIGADEYGEPELPVPGANTGIYCSNSTTWNGTTWSNGFPTSSVDVIFNANFTQTGGTMEACSIFVLAGAQVNFISNSNAVVTHNVTVATGGSLTFESGSNLTQIENTANVGNVTVKRNSSRLKRLDYTLWSAPVTGQTLLSFSPATTVDRFYTYNSTTNQYNSVVPSTTNFTAGKGYLIRMPNADSTPGYNAGGAAIVYKGEFKGVPNNGNVRLPLTYISNTQSYNAVGNPYPSPINITDFLDANAGIIDGTIYIWRKTNDPTKSSYWTCNKAGAIANNAPGGGGASGNDLNDLLFSPYAVDGTGLLSTGQGFIVKAAAANKELVFRNNMRRTTNNSMILRNGNTSATADTNANRIWLNVVNSANAFSQTMIGYMPEGTTGYDDGYDSVSLMDGGINLYTVQADNKLAIQTRPEFINTDVVPVGFKTNVAGTFEIKIDKTDGLFTGDQAIYLKDKATNTIQNLKEGSYSFTTETGTFNDRFEMMFVNEGALGTDNPVIAANDIIVYADTKQVKVTAPEAIKNVIIYDLLGKVLYEKNNIDTTEFTSADINTANQVIIVKVMLDNGQAVAKKLW